jgi:parallel beta-helix repeat protein
MDQIVHQVLRSRNPGFSGEMKPVAMALGLAFGLGVGVAPAASAATLTVLNNADSGAGSLRATIAGAASGDTIVFGSVTGTIPLATELTINVDVTISGPGASSLTLAPSSTNRAIHFGQNHTTAISGVTFQGNGTATAKGAGIYHYAGTLTISNCVFNGNVTTGNGGAIWNYGGTLNIHSSTFTGNHAVNGGAIFLYGNTNSATIQQSTFSGNVATGKGGAIFLYYSGGITISDSTISGNQATGGGGGAIYFYKAGNSTITNSTISGNTAGGRGGGAIVLYKSVLAVNNSTVTGNSTTNAGGAFYLSDGGNLTSPHLILTSSIVANNSSEVGPNDLARANGTIDATNSLILNPAGNINGMNTANIIGVNPMLGPLLNNGGPTMTHALLAGSPAINAGSNPLALAFDQRGTPFVRSSGVTDIGAYEVQGAPPPPPVANVPVPTLSQWGLALLGAMMAGLAMLTGFGKRRRR